MNKIDKLSEKSFDNLEAARVLFDKQLFTISISRSYFAMYYLCVALLHYKAITITSHEEVIQLFEQEYIQKSIFSNVIFSYLKDGYRLKTISDYDFEKEITQEMARKILFHAEQFCIVLRQYIKNSL